LKYELRGSEVAPAADVKLVADVDASRNVTQLQLDVKHLTPAARVLDGGTTYVAWARRDSTVPWVRLGGLELSDEGRAGSATLTVSEVAFDVKLTAERDVTCASPSDKTVFEQRVQSD